ncbi:kelch-like protein 26 [Arctopsyche grandis]|uniref:kelch-like protein 26 n=1 Tax=Arctopsyche grandis TaxID=121162 RepID=UPI00406D6D13
MCDLHNSVHIFRNPDHKTNVLDRIYTMYQQNRRCDVEIVLNNQRYQGHSVVLSAISEYFDTKLDNNLGTSLKEISIDNLDNDATQRVIDYCYTGEIEFSHETVLKIISTAGLFQLEPVVKACCDFMASIINTENCLQFDETVNLYGYSSLAEKVTNYILKNYKKISQTTQFLSISVERLHRFLQMNLNVSSERDVFDSVKAWLYHDMPNRKQHIPLLLTSIILPSLPDSVIFGEVQPLCEGVPNCPDLIVSALKWKNSPSTRLNSAIQWNKSRTPLSTIIVAGNWRHESVSKVEIYDPNNDSWKEFLNTNITRKNAGYVLIGDELIAIGGIDSAVHTTVESVNLKTGKKLTLPPLQEARHTAVATVIEDVIYIFGGNNGSKTINSVEKWDPVTRKWSFTTPMKIGREGCGIAVLDNEIYVIGGFNRRFAKNDTGYDTVEAFCPFSQMWRTCVSLNEARLAVSAISIEDKIYVFGGRLQGNFNTSIRYKSVECYNKKTNMWSFVSDISSSRYGVASGILGNDLVIVGGADLVTWDFNSVEKYDVNLNKWKPLAPVLEKRENTNVFSVPISWLYREISLN